MNKEQHTATDNELIAGFMGVKETETFYDSYGKQTPIWFVEIDSPKFRSLTYNQPGLALKDCWKDFRYDTSWDWLMPVVQKIGDMWMPPNEDGDSPEIGAQADQVASLPIASHIQQVYNRVVEFIKWYNANL